MATTSDNRGRSTFTARESILVLGDDRQTLEGKFEVVRAMAEIGHPYAMVQEHFTLFLVQKPRGWTLQDGWPRLKKFE